MPRSKLFSTLFVAAGRCRALVHLDDCQRQAGIGWRQSDEQQVGAVKDTRLRAMSSYCTGVTVTPQGTWLVARLEREARELEPSAGVLDLDALVYGQPKQPNEAEESGTFAGLFSHGDKETTFISPPGRPRAISARGTCQRQRLYGSQLRRDQVFLLTGLRRPETANTHDPDQTVVFRTDDQGQRWTWLTKGWFPEAESLAWSLAPISTARMKSGPQARRTRWMKTAMKRSRLPFPPASSTRLIRGRTARR